MDQPLWDDSRSPTIKKEQIKEQVKSLLKL